MTQERRPLQFKKPGAAGEPERIVVRTVVRVVDGAGRTVREGAGEATMPYPPELLYLDLEGKAGQLATGGVEQLQREDAASPEQHSQDEQDKGEDGKDVAREPVAPKVSGRKRKS